MTKLFIIESEYVQHGMVFNQKKRYAVDPVKADEIYEEVLQKMKEDNGEMISDKGNYKIHQSKRKEHKFFECYYKYQPGVSNFSVSISTGVLEGLLVSSESSKL